MQVYRAAGIDEKTRQDNKKDEGGVQVCLPTLIHNLPVLCAIKFAVQGLDATTIKAHSVNKEECHHRIWWRSPRTKQMRDRYFWGERRRTWWQPVKIRYAVLIGVRLCAGGDGGCLLPSNPPHLLQLEAFKDVFTRWHITSSAGCAYDEIFICHSSRTPGWDYPICFKS